MNKWIWIKLADTFFKRIFIQSVHQIHDYNWMNGKQENPRLSYCAAFDVNKENCFIKSTWK